MQAPRIALLVHNRFEADPRVSRHARAARDAGYRVAVLSVVAVRQDQRAGRWHEQVDGIAIFESRVVRRTWLGRQRGVLAKAMRLGSATQVPPSDDQAMPTPQPIVPTGGGTKVSARQACRDLVSLLLLLRNNYGVFRQFRGIGAALVHANDLNVLPASLLLARAWHAPLLYDSHELWTQLDQDWSPFLRWLYAMLERQLIRRAAAVVTVNGAIADELARRYSIDRPVVVMNCPVAPASDVVLARHDGDQLRCIYQGMLNPNRGLVELVDTMAQLEGVQLSIRGSGVLAVPLQQRIDALALGHRVKLLPPVPMSELVAALAGFDVGIVPYLPVGLNNILCSPNKLFEYMAAGLAVVCSDLPVLREVVTQAQCGLLYEPGSHAMLIEALRQLLLDRSLLNRMRQHALQAVTERYNAAYEEGTLMHLYGQLIGVPSDTSRQPGTASPTAPAYAATPPGYR